LRKLDYSISIVAKAATFSEWNFNNKAALLKAELASVENDDDEADDQYDFAIAAARSSKFINEEVSMEYFNSFDAAYSFATFSSH
jgi:hypothetical protein